MGRNTIHKTPENLRTPIYYLKGYIYSTLYATIYGAHNAVCALKDICIPWVVEPPSVEAIHKAVVDGVGC